MEPAPTDLIRLRIDGEPCAVPAGTSLIEAIRAQGRELPSLCYFPGIDPPLGTCRVCMVEVDGRPTAACTALARAGTEVVTDTPALRDLRQAVLEMMFAEGNHFCPACEKSGDCDLQHLGYQAGITISRFPHLFRDRPGDLSGRRLLIDRNRCILCHRCVVEVHTAAGEAVFALHGRGPGTRVVIDHAAEAQLSEAAAQAAVHLCPTGAILYRGQSLSRPPGSRRYDTQAGGYVEPQQRHARAVPPGPKVLATASLAGCFGCHMSLLDIDEEILDLAQVLRFDKSPINDLKAFTGRCDVGLIEGGCCNAENVEVLKAFREKCDILVAVGECAIMGGIPAMRNGIPLRACLEEAFVQGPTVDPASAHLPGDPDLPVLLDRVYPIPEVVAVDYYLPGCPPPAGHIRQLLRHLLLGEPYSVLYADFKYD